jgi:hypothetical protein
LIVTFVLPGCETIAVVTGFGWLLSQVTVCPVVGVTVGVQAARTGSTAQQSAAVASAKVEAVEHRLARPCSGVLAKRPGTKRSNEDADRIIDPAKVRDFETTHRSAAQLTTAAATQTRCQGSGSRFIFDRCRNGTTAGTILPTLIPGVRPAKLHSGPVGAAQGRRARSASLNAAILSV